MKKRINYPFRKLISLLGVSAMLTSLFFCRPLYADTIPTSEILGVDKELKNVVTVANTSGTTYTYIYELTIKFKSSYVGKVKGTLSYSYSGASGSQTLTTNVNNFINGNEIRVTVSCNTGANSYQQQGPLYSQSFLIDNTETNVIKYEDIDSLEQIINLLTDIYNSNDQVEGLLNNQLTQLQQIVSNTSLADTYLLELMKIKQWNVPIESLNIVLWSIGHHIQNENAPYKYNLLEYPMFFLRNGDYIVNNNAVWNRCCWVFVSNIWLTKDIFSNYFETNYTIESFERINSGDYKTYKVYFNGSSVFSLKFISSITNFVYIPIYFGYEPTNVSLDFALNYGFSNRLLDSIDKIANGTIQSNSSSSSLDSGTNQMTSDSDSMFEYEDSFNNNLNDSLDDINVQVDAGSLFGSKFLSSANWVKVQFDNLTNNTPFGSVLGFTLLLGLALLIVGKWLG